MEFTQEIENFEGIITSLELRKLDLEVQKGNTQDPRLILIIINLVIILNKWKNLWKTAKYLEKMCEKILQRKNR